MIQRKIISLFAVAVVALIILYDVTLVMDFGGTVSVSRPDPSVEAQFARCFQERDEAMHDNAFATIDNPDVQREHISANRARITRECRNLHPQQLIDVQEESEFNLIDIDARFW